LVPRRSAGVARLEFAITVVVLGVISALALERIARLQASANEVIAQTSAAQARSIAALVQARDFLLPSPAASTPCSVTPVSMPLESAASGVQKPSSCPSTHHQGDSP